MIGRPRNIESSEKLWEYFIEYERQTKSDPIKVQDFVGKDGDEVNRERERPLTIEGFECYLFEQGIINDLGDYLSNKDGRYSEFATICRAIKRKVRRDQIEGGMAGIYNPSITQRLNGLVDQKASDDKQDVTIRVKYDRKGNNPGGATQQPTEGTE
jgi:hypothetical protein